MKKVLQALALLLLVSGAVSAGSVPSTPSAHDGSQTDGNRVAWVN